MRFRILLGLCPSVRDEVSAGTKGVQDGRRFLNLDSLESRLWWWSRDVEDSLDRLVFDERGLQEGERV